MGNDSPSSKTRGQLQVTEVIGGNRKSMLGDLVILTGGTVYTDELDIKLERDTPNLLGSTGSITITKEDTTISNGEESKDSIQARKQILSIVADPTTSKFDKLQEWFAKLGCGMAVIKVRCSSEVEVGRRRARTMMRSMPRMSLSRKASCLAAV